MPTQEQWHRHWLEVAQVTAKLSKDPTTQVGAVVVTQDNRQCSIGYNGFAMGIEETPEKWQRPTKYEYVIHAELNAILNCPFDHKGCKLYLTLQPCHRCIEMVLNSGILDVYYLKEYENLCHKDIWLEHASKLRTCKLIKDII
jgi:dCMP deaminase